MVGPVSGSNNQGQTGDVSGSSGIPQSIVSKIDNSLKDVLEPGLKQILNATYTAGGAGLDPKFLSSMAAQCANILAPELQSVAKDTSDSTLKANATHLANYCLNLSDILSYSQTGSGSPDNYWSQGRTTTDPGPNEGFNDYGALLGAMVSPVIDGAKAILGGDSSFFPSPGDNPLSDFMKTQPLFGSTNTQDTAFNPVQQGNGLVTAMGLQLFSSLDMDNETFTDRSQGDSILNQVYTHILPEFATGLHYVDNLSEDFTQCGMSPDGATQYIDKSNPKNPITKDITYNNLKNDPNAINGMFADFTSISELFRTGFGDLENAAGSGS